MYGKFSLYLQILKIKACSDNTIRAGLTPKFKDFETLCNSLTYNMSGPPYFKPQELEPGVLEYAPPVPEFAVQKITVIKNIQILHANFRKKLLS